MARLPAPSTTVRWILTIVVVGVLVGIGVTRYARLQSEQELLLASIAQTNKTIETLRATDLSAARAEVDALQSRSNNAASTEASLSQRFRGYAHSIEIQERLYRAATESDVTITSLNCDGPKALDAGGMRFETYTVSVSAESAVPPSLLNFLQKVSGYYESGSIGSVNVSLPPPPTEGSSTTKSTVSFALRVVYLPQESA